MVCVGWGWGGPKALQFLLFLFFEIVAHRTISLNLLYAFSNYNLVITASYTIHVRFVVNDNFYNAADCCGFRLC